MNSKDQEASEFLDLLARMRRGSPEAAWELVEKYSSHVLRVVRRHLHFRIRNKFDSEDFVQLVWSSFFRSPELLNQAHSPLQFVGLLAAMARNKVLDEVRQRTRTKKYNVLRETSLDNDIEICGELITDDPTPSAIAIAREKWHELIKSETENVRRVIELRLTGATFDEIGNTLGINERTARRIIERLTQNHSVAEAGDE